jgi:hypothetical protein
MNSFQLSFQHPNTTIGEFRLLNQLEIGDRIQIDTTRNDYRDLNGSKHLATIVGFKYPEDSHPISVIYDDQPNKVYQIPLKWIDISETILRDIKLNRILDEIIKTV